LFSKAQSYAKEIGIQELKAKQYANLLKQLTQKAQNKRLMLFQVKYNIKIIIKYKYRKLILLNY